MANRVARSEPDGGDALRKLLNLDWYTGFVQCSVLKSIVDLGIPDILSKAGGQSSVRDVAAQLPTKTANVGFLARIMTFAAIGGVFEDLTDSNVLVVEDGEKRFGLTETSKLLVEKEAKEPRLSMAHWVRFCASKKAMEPYGYLADAVLTGKEPFDLAFGMSEWDQVKTDPEFGKLLNKGMAASATYIMSELLKSYKGFEGVTRLVDVGGGLGASLAAITQAHPGLTGVNFDLPQTVSTAPDIPRVEHVGGDMFKQMPEGDAILMKYILHDWTDQECVHLLSNCHKSLPVGGKVIIADYVLPAPKEASPAQYMRDVAMLAHTSGRERTAPEWRLILNEANFHRVEIVHIPSVDQFVVEGYKS